MKVFLYLLPLVALPIMQFSSWKPFRAPLPFRVPPAPHNFQLVKTWIPTFCKRERCKSAYLSPSFTLHGLWPAGANGNTVTNCPGDKDIRREINALRTELHQAWPSIRTEVSDDIFWQHEWNEHGICKPTTMTKMTYFQSAIRETKAFNLLGILQNANVYPTYNIDYRRSDFHNAVKDSPQIGKNVYVSCRPFNTSHVLLEEILICLDITATQYIDCPSNPSHRGCPVRQKIIIFPPN